MKEPESIMGLRNVIFSPHKKRDLSFIKLVLSLWMQWNVISSCYIILSGQRLPYTLFIYT